MRILSKRPSRVTIYSPHATPVQYTSFLISMVVSSGDLEESTRTSPSPTTRPFHISTMLESSPSTAQRPSSLSSTMLPTQVIIPTRAITPPHSSLPSIIPPAHPQQPHSRPIRAPMAVSLAYVGMSRYCPTGTPSSAGPRTITSPNTRRMAGKCWTRSLLPIASRYTAATSSRGCRIRQTRTRRSKQWPTGVVLGWQRR